MATKVKCFNCNAHFKPVEILTKEDILRFDSLLRDNHPLTSIEKLTVSKLKKSIFHYDELIMSLQNKREELKRHASRYASFSSPVRRLPAEILLQIFRNACHDTDMIVSRYTKQKLVALNLGQVCSYWRNIVLSNEELWAMLGKLTIDEDFGALPLPLLELYLSRSGSKLLTFSLSQHQFDEDDEINPATARLVQCSGRWGDVDIEAVYSEVAIDPHTVAFTALERLVLDTASTYSLDWSVFSNAPRLRTLILHGMSVHPGLPVPEPTDFPWSQLQQLELHEPPDFLWQEILPLCTQLVRFHLSLHLQDGSAIGDDVLTPIVLPNLSMSLTFTALWPTKFFNSFTFPFLTSLDLSLGGTRAKSTLLRAVHSFISSHCTISRFSLTDKIEIFSSTTLIELLQLLPALTHLTLHGLPVSKTFLEQLNPFLCSSSKILLPNLLDLGLTTRSSLSSFDYETFVNLLRARWKPSGNENFPRICCARLRTYCKREVFDRSLLPQIEALNMFGMTISITDNEGLVF